MLAVCLCRLCHDSLHQLGRRTYEERVGITPLWLEFVAGRLLAKWVESKLRGGANGLVREVGGVGAAGGAVQGE